MSKINQALIEWKTGDVHGLSWLRERGLSKRHSYFYVGKSILQKVGPGVFCKAGDIVVWEAIVRYIQEELKLPVHVAGKTALGLQGSSHYLQLSEIPTIELVSFEKKRLPEWIEELKFPAKFNFKKSGLIKKESFLNHFEKSNFIIKISSRELAVLEMLEELDLSSSLETAENYMNALNTLRPAMVEEVLSKCNSVKVKRIFLYLSEKLELPFLNNLDLKKVSLGKGKRVVVKGGQLDKKYQITVDRIAEENPF